MNERVQKTFLLSSAIETEEMAMKIASSIQAPALIFLEGQLGAGKTTFVKGFLRGLGFVEKVKSPTFTLIEIYTLREKQIVHADLYRIQDTQELEAIGLRDYFTDKNIILIEWASRAAHWLPKPSLLCHLKIPEQGEGRVLDIKKYEHLVL